MLMYASGCPRGYIECSPPTPPHRLFWGLLAHLQVWGGVRATAGQCQLLETLSSVELPLSVCVWHSVITIWPSYWLGRWQGLSHFTDFTDEEAET